MPSTVVRRALLFAVVLFCLGGGMSTNAHAVWVDGPDGTGDFSLEIRSGPDQDATVAATRRVAFTAQVDGTRWQMPCGVGAPSCPPLLTEFVRVECQLDAGPTTPCAMTRRQTTNVNSVNVSIVVALDAGPHQLTIRAIWGCPHAWCQEIVATPTIRRFTVASGTPPDPGAETWFITAPATFGNTTPVSVFDADGGNAPVTSVRCRVDLAPYSSCSSPWTLSALAPGTHTISIQALTGTGADPLPAQAQVGYYTGVPDTRWSSTPPTSVSTPSATFRPQYVTSTPGNDFECRLDGGGWFACVAPGSGSAVLSGLSEGPHQLEVRAIDYAGNVDPSPLVQSFVVDLPDPPDTTPPETTITEGPPAVTTRSDPVFAFTSSEANSIFRCSVDQGPANSCTSGSAVAPLVDGPHVFRVFAIDQQFNADPTPATRSFVVDTTPPDTTLSQAPGDLIGRDHATFGLTSDDPEATFECRLDNEDWATCDAEVRRSSLGEGLHVFHARATDGIGNTDASPASVAFTVDTTAPDTLIDSGPDATIAQAVATFAFHADDATATFECRADQGAYEPCATPVTYDELDDGNHELSVRAADAAGNVDPTPATRTFTVDTTPPETTITAAPAERIVAADVRFAFQANEPNATFACRIDGAEWDQCAEGEASYHDLEDGTHAFEVRASDALGNVDGSPAARSFTIDTTPPDTFITAGPTEPSTAADIAFDYEANDPSANFECRLDGGAWQSCLDVQTAIGSLPPGAHVFEVRASDDLANTDLTPALRAFDVVAASIDPVEPGPVVPDPVVPEPIDSGLPRPLTPAPATPANDTMQPLTLDLPQPFAGITESVGGGVRAVSTCTRLVAPGARSTSPRAELGHGAFAQINGPAGAIAVRSSTRPATFRLQIDGGRLPRGGARVAFKLDGQPLAKVSRDQHSASPAWTTLIAASRLALGHHRLAAEVHIGARRRTTTLAFSAENCPPASVRLFVRARGSHRAPTDLLLRATSGGPSLKAVRFGLPARASVRLPSGGAAFGLGALTLRRGALPPLRFALRLDGDAEGASLVTILKRGGLKVTLSGGRGGSVDAQGLPAGTQSVEIDLRGARRQTVSIARPCAVSRSQTSLTDAGGGHVTVVASNRSRC